LDRRRPANATNAAFDHSELDPGIGSSTLGKLLGIPGLRTWRVAKVPLMWGYFERGDHLDVVRLLGERQDLAAILGDEFAEN
jgi:toxin ParE1/3/4